MPLNTCLLLEKCIKILSFECFVWYWLKSSLPFGLVSALLFSFPHCSIYIELDSVGIYLLWFTYNTQTWIKVMISSTQSHLPPSSPGIMGSDYFTRDFIPVIFQLGDVRGNIVFGKIESIFIIKSGIFVMWECCCMLNSWNYI